MLGHNLESELLVDNALHAVAVSICIREKQLHKGSIQKTSEVEVYRGRSRNFRGGGPHCDRGWLLGGSGGMPLPEKFLRFAFSNALFS